MKKYACISILKAFSLICFSFFFQYINSQISTSENYIYKTMMMNENGTTMSDVQYFDGLGRPIQVVKKGITPNGSDLVTYQEYDGLGRESNSWLPIVAIDNYGRFMPLREIQNKAPQTYNNTKLNPAIEARPYNVIIYEPSPLNRVRETYAAGQDWFKEKKLVKTENKPSGTSTIPKLKYIDFFHEGYGIEEGYYFLWGDKRECHYTEKKTYSDGSIRYIVTMHGNQPSLIRNIVNGEEFDTYFVLDYSCSYDKLAFIIPPEAMKKYPHGTTNEIQGNTEFMNSIYHFYIYNGIPKAIKCPGKDWDYIDAEKKYAQIVFQYLNNKQEDYLHIFEHGVKTEYLINGALACALFSVDGAGNTTKVKKNNYYAVGQLYATKVTDEDKNVSYEFKDKLGQVILTRQMVGTAQHDTYYVYDDFGNLCFVLPPLASDGLLPHNGSWDDTNATGVKRYAYIYRYDGRNRCIWKKLPGVEPIFYIYDKADQLILSQDGEQRKKGEWAFNKYDAFGRIIISGMHKTADSHATLIAKCQNIVVREITSGGSYGYSWNSLPEILSSGALLVNHYDDYDHLLNRSPNFRSKLDYIEKADYGKRYIHAGLGMKTPKGSLVGTRVRLTQPDGTISGEIVTAMYYDNRGRLIQTKSINHLDGVEEENIAYNFTNQPIKKMHVHTAPGKGTQTELYTYTYDHAGRLLDTKHKWNAGAETLIATNTYDELGRLKTNKKGNNANLNTTYEYNVRSWTTKMSSPLFTQNLFYNVSPAGFANKQQYGGNISAMSWTVKGDAERKYGFTYDNLSRLKQADYGYATSGGSFSTSYTYDKHGNMLNHTQRGLKAAATYDTVDNLAMSYIGNQLVNVHNVGTGSNASVTHAHFQDYSKDAVKTKVEYAYNANGAMTQDLNKGISTIQYNSLNLPRQMDIKSPVAEARNEYTYSASGQKLRVVSKWNSTYNKAPIIGSAINASLLNMSKTTDYVGNKIYENGVLKRILIDGGYIEASKYHYYQTDHLGNNRVVADNLGYIVQSTHYYPFGMAFAEATGGEKQPYKYNGKELDAQHGLNTYDYSARYMDPGIGRFSSVDPLAEKYYHESPYIYVANNPILNIDPDGREKLNGFTKNAPLANVESRAISNRRNIDNNMIHIYSHGSFYGFTFVNDKGKSIQVRTAKDFSRFMNENSTLWRKSQGGKGMHVVLQSCGTGVNSDDAFAATMSREFPHTYFIAPQGQLLLDPKNGTSSVEYVPFNSDGYDYVNSSNSHWNVFKEGEVIKKIDGKIQLDEANSATKEVPNYRNIWDFIYQARQAGATFQIY